MNNITVAGNITRDSEVRYLPNGDAVASFSIADNQGKDKDAIFWNCSLFGKRADSLNQYLVKGASVTVIGSVTQEKWTDKQSGAERVGFKIRVNDIALQGGKTEPRQEQAQRPVQQAKPAQYQHKDSNGDSFEDDLPF